MTIEKKRRMRNMYDAVSMYCEKSGFKMVVLMLEEDDSLPEPREGDYTFSNEHCLVVAPNDAHPADYYEFY